jgi:LacI family transcriptional regulator
LILANKAAHLRPETRQRVLLAAREMGYRPNAAAKAISKGRFGAVGLLLSTNGGRSRISPGLLDGIYHRLAAEDLKLTVVMLPDERLTSDGIVPSLLREWSCDGLLINYTDHIPQRMIDLIEQYQLPSVWINTRRPFDCVHPDDYGAGMAAAQKLMELGHTRIAYLDYNNGYDDLADAHYSVRDRQAGYEAAMRGAGLHPQVLRERKKVDPGERLALWRAALSGPGRPTAVIAYSLPVRVLVDARNWGIEIPRGLSLMTFDSADTSYLSGMTIQHAAIGEAAAGALLEKIRSPLRQNPAAAVPMMLQAGETLAAPPA